MGISGVRTVLDGLWFGEGPRWHDGALWFSDMHGHRVVRTSLDGTSDTVVEITHDEPSGLGWLPDGRLLVVAMETQKLLRVEPDGTISEHADLSGLARGSINDMIVAAPGINSVKDLKGKKIGVELNFVDHLLLLKALEANGMSEADVTLVNMPRTTRRRRWRRAGCRRSRRGSRTPGRR